MRTTGCLKKQCDITKTLATLIVRSSVIFGHILPPQRRETMAEQQTEALRAAVECLEAHGPHLKNGYTERVIMQTHLAAAK